MSRMFRRYALYGRKRGKTGENEIKRNCNGWFNKDGRVSKQQQQFKDTFQHPPPPTK